MASAQPSSSSMSGMDTRTVEGSGFRVQGSGFRGQGSGFRVQGSGFRVQGSGFRVQGSGFRVQGSGFMVQGSGFKNAMAGHGVCPPLVLQHVGHANQNCVGCRV